MRHQMLIRTFIGVLVLCASSLQADVINEYAKLLPSNGAAYDEFGKTVSISGDTVVVGVRYDDDSGSSSGSAYVFRKSGPSWVQVAKLLASGGAAYDNFGWSVSISGDIVVVGARNCDGSNGIDSGSAYVFVKPVGGWSGTLYEDAKLVASDGAEEDRFGHSVSVSGNTIVIGAPWDDDGSTDAGSAYVFQKIGSSWVQMAKLLASGGAAYDIFGDSVSISDETVVVGAYGDDGYGGIDSGSAYVFQMPAGGWSGTLYEDATLLASDSAANDEFGYSVSVSEETVAVGAAEDDDNGTDSGSTYVFQMPVGGWSGTVYEDAKLLASDGAVSNFFGESVSISIDTVVVGAIHSNGYFGSAYAFQMPAGGWSGTLYEDVRLLASDGAVSDHFGHSVSISDDIVVVGAPGDDDNGAWSGSTYVYELNTSPCPADLTGDDQVNIEDIFAVLGLWGACPDPCPPYCSGDLTEDCTVNIDDIFAILGLWGPCE